MASNGENLAQKTQVVVVLIAFPAQGHLNQLLHLSNLISSHNIPVHYVSTVTHIRQATLRHHKSISNIHFHAFEVPPFVSPPPNSNTSETDFPSHLIPSFEASMHLRDPVRKLLQSLSAQGKRVVVIYDSLMGSVAQDATNMPNSENYTFHSTCAFTNFLYFWEEKGKPSVNGVRLPEFPSLEGCFPTEFIDFISEKIEFLKFSDGNIYNTSRAIEDPYIKLVENIEGGKKVWALGPLNPLAVEKKESKVWHPCLEWLDKQEPDSVIYVSFGTTTALREEQIQEVATGLEQSKQKFIWVLRDADKGNIFDEKEAKRHDLPNGFEERVKGMGVVVRDWAPQLEILSHPSTGGFMSHCGWNSCLESLSMGVPMATWPMHSDQPRNAVLVTEVLKVGLVVKEWSQRKSLVSASVVESGVRRLMGTREGDEMRERALRLKNAIQRSKDEGGDSRMEMESFIAHITK
ncbi:zeatin O-glucosyltransferase-like [Vigna unguiculata]|uniref:Glycosyltransferase n=1 Tax=Vigna unguiculata TaxID=3917 RepID=A0A4D6MZJ2_VIGUN|nr:zeatin O-glucosyltransferase-like [Vigna unguiculata]QCE05285.1 cis-zeatin O-glucosyltransferase [Vigna unguiculata]